MTAKIPVALAAHQLKSNKNKPKQKLPGGAPSLQGILGNPTDLQALHNLHIVGIYNERRTGLELPTQLTNL